MFTSWLLVGISMLLLSPVLLIMLISAVLEEMITAMINAFRYIGRQVRVTFLNIKCLIENENAELIVTVPNEYYENEEP